MARLARVLAVGVPHHITQRGNGRAFVLDEDGDRRVYCGLLQEHCNIHGVTLLGYCLMSNHVHLIAVPQKPDSLALTLKQAHGRFASYRNSAYRTSGHVWQGRFYSCPLDEAHLWEALRYTELNPVRAGLVAEAPSWPWSSAGVHCGMSAGDSLVDRELWTKKWTEATWLEYLEAGSEASTLDQLRKCTHTGRPLGSVGFVQGLEASMRRKLAPRKGGRPAKPAVDPRQRAFHFSESF